MIRGAIQHAVHIEAVRRVEAGEKKVVIFDHNTNDPCMFKVESIMTTSEGPNFAIGTSDRGESYAMELSR